MSILEHNSLTISKLTKKIKEMESKVDEEIEKVTESIKQSSTSNDEMIWKLDDIDSTSAVETVITYGNDVFVIIATPGGGPASSFRSTDGINWVKSEAPSGQWRKLIYANGIFVAVSPSPSSDFMYSTDAVNWTKTPINTDYKNRNDIAYGGGRFVVTLAGYDKVAYSTDGINWQLTQMPANKNWRSIAYGKDRFVALIYDYYTSNEQMAAYSLDGVNWTSTQMPCPSQWKLLAYGNDRFVAFTHDKQVAYSSDGVNWEISPLEIAFQPSKLSFLGGRFVALPDLGNDIVSSYDGITWAPMKTIPVAKYWDSLAYGNNRIVAVDRNGKNIIYSVSMTEQQSIIDIIYPIGSSMLIDSDPKTLPHFDFTTWELVETGKWRRTV